MKKYFSEIVGQESVKTKLAFLIENTNSIKFWKPLIILGQYGAGKTTLARQCGKYIEDHAKRGYSKKFIEVNGAELSSVGAFFTKIVPHLSTSNCFVFIDETHAVDDKLKEAFLTIFETSNSTTTHYIHEGTDHVFDFSRHSFVFGSTEGHLISPTLMSRFEVVELEDYDLNHVAQMFVQKMDDIKVNEEVIQKFVQSVKHNPREISNLSHTIKGYMTRKKRSVLDEDSWREIYNGLQLKPLGLNHIEIRILRTLKKYPNSSLTKISANLGLSCAALRQCHEIPLLQLGLLNIKAGTGRSLSAAGHKYIDDLELTKE